MKYLTTVLILACSVNIAIAGLDEARKYDEVIAIYRFENALDSEPREFHGRLLGDAANIDVADNRWHHIAFTRYGDIYTLFLDGEVVERRYVDTYVGFFSDKTHVYVFSNKLNRNALVDDLGFFEIGFSVYEIRAIIDEGLDAFLQAMPVDPAEKIATTWASVKSQYSFRP